ncbi:DUF6153 family protein [Streptomyces sp. A3M-1-3]|uniref:DUF6153 family protein n=1 Tax=Streptomyces sp. A3M-1-3 TaxID=2962044 RepID=UPI0020B87E33|nr:DUF6153 family protein [Streptomyces sp. A3M-1-3]MCP3820243.1 DUF6153 family protein [Streptomyces sp. A3M-1-3]
MTSAAQLSSRRPAGRGFLLLVLAVLAGVLAMHGLGPGPVPAKAAAAASGQGMLMAHGEAEAGGDCSHTAGGTGHVSHADATCAAAGVGAPYVAPALAAAVDLAPTAVALTGGAAEAPEGGRALPDLAELQLLRI